MQISEELILQIYRLYFFNLQNGKENPPNKPKKCDPNKIRWVGWFWVNCDPTQARMDLNTARMQRTQILHLYFHNYSFLRASSPEL